MGLLNEDDGKLIYLVPQGIQGNLDLNSTNKLILTATESFSRTDTAVVSSFPVSNNTSHGDHYRFNGSTITFKGVLSPDVLTLISLATGEALPPIQNYISNVRNMMRMVATTTYDDFTFPRQAETGITSPLVNVHIPDENSVFNCVITSFKISRDVKVSDGYYVEVTAKELLIADVNYTVKPKNDTVTQESNNGTDSPVDKKITSDIVNDIADSPSRFGTGPR